MNANILDRRTLIRGAAGTAIAGGLVVTAGEDAHAARPDILREGDRGWWVWNVQRRLLAANFWHSGNDGAYGFTTQQAVMALQKAHGLTRDGVVGPNTWPAIYDPDTPRPRTAASWEIDKDRQLQLDARWGWANWVFNTSTGSGQRYWHSGGYWAVADTPSGRFDFFRRVDGMDRGPLGSLWRPIYFNGGIAVHGFDYVPGYPASHGCCRVSDPAMNFIWRSGRAPLGRSVYVY